LAPTQPRRRSTTIIANALRVADHLVDRLVPLGRIAEPEEIADAVLWLAGTSYATGAVLSVDGGYTAR
jgi:NAD(P)-dependent dehydrogenase (short-subunit alcohol dehydrogenase family)